MKWANYLEFILQSLNKNNKNNNIFAMRGKEIERLTTHFQTAVKNPKKKSLRAVCSDLNYADSYYTNLSSAHKAARDLLVNGL